MVSQSAQLMLFQMPEYGLVPLQIIQVSKDLPVLKVLKAQLVLKE
jgi:hypothetical protein